MICNLEVVMSDPTYPYSYLNAPDSVTYHMSNVVSVNVGNHDLVYVAA